MHQEKFDWETNWEIWMVCVCEKEKRGRVQFQFILVDLSGFLLAIMLI